tara:strand:- start:4940 stop:6232 length:1293 start_codon:yes stop_codon:yes gene_type:complete
MTNENQTLDEKPITEGNDSVSAVNDIWDIDETNFDDAFNLETNADPVLGIDLGEEKKEEVKAEEKAEMPEPLDDTETDGPKEEAPKEETETPVDEKAVDALLDGDLDSEEKSSDDEVDTTEDSKKADESSETSEEDLNEFAIFAQMLADKELLDLNEEDFEPTEKGLLDAFADTIENRVKEEIESFQKTLPKEGKELLTHLMKGGKVSNFMEVYSTPNFGDLNIKGNNIGNQKAVLAEFFKLRGDSQEDIAEMLEDYENLGKLEKQAAKAQARLTQYYEHQKQQLIVKQEQAEKERIAKRQEVQNNIQTTISESDEIKGFPLSRKSKKKLMSYMTEANVKIETPDGPQFVTQFQADEMKSSSNIEDFILKAYLRMTNYSLDGVQKKSKSKLASQLRTTLQNKKRMTDTKATFGGNKTPGGATKSSTAWDI